jgi:hypothetical protein
VILGRNTQQWMGLITSVIGFIGTIVQILWPQAAGPVGIILTGATGVLGILIAFIANTHTTPINDARIPVGTVMSATDPNTGMVLGHVQVPQPEPAPVVEDLGEPDEAVDFEGDPGDEEDGVA